MVIIEAMSFGCPVVASDVGGINEIVVNDWNGYTVENDVRSFTDKIKYILENRDVYEQLSMNAKEQFEKKLTVEEMASAYLSIYHS